MCLQEIHNSYLVSEKLVVESIIRYYNIKEMIEWVNEGNKKWCF